MRLQSRCGRATAGDTKVQADHRQAWRYVTDSGHGSHSDKFCAVIGAPLPGAGQDNPKCKDAEHFPPDQTENLRSLGGLITFGKLRLLDLGDLTRD